MAEHVVRLLDALDAFEDGVYIINDDYTVEYMNKAMKNIFGEGTGKKCYQVVNKSEEVCSWCQREGLFTRDETFHNEIYIEYLDKYFQLRKKPVINRDGSRSLLSIYRDITQRKKNEEKLKSSKESYQRLFKYAGCGVFISSKQGRFLDVNPALLMMCGYENEKDEFLSLDLAKDVYLRPGDRTKYQHSVEKEGSVVDYELEWKRKDQGVINILITSNVRYGTQGEILGYEGIVVDQTARKKSENQIRKAYDFLDNIISCSPNAIMAMDMKGLVVLWNKGAEEAFGYSPEQVVNEMSIQQIYSRDTAIKVMKMMRSNNYGGKGRLNSYPLTFQKNSGEFVEGNLSASIVYNENGEETASVAIFVNLNERLKMERELGNARQHLLQSEKLAAMGRLTSQIAHELNNPLFGIMNTLELMKTEISPQNKRRKLLDMSLSEIMRLADMLKKMLSFSKPDQEEKAELEIDVVLEELLLLYEKRFRENSVKVTTSLEEDLGLIYGSKDQLRQVFINMFSNAMDAMPNGGKLELSTSTTGKYLQIVIADSGTGIAKENIEKIFDSFFTTKTEELQGVGLGLSVCYGFVKEHHGEINVESQEGKGAKFTILLPFAS